MSKSGLALIVLFLLIGSEFLGVVFNLVDEVIAFLLLHLKMETFSCVFALHVLELTHKLIIGLIKFISKI